MNPKSRFDEIGRVFLVVKAVDASCRELELQRLCGGDVDLERGVRELLRGDACALPFEALGDHMKEVHDGIVIDDGDEPIDAGDSPEIGRYKLLEKIGEGGFGTVYMAEQMEPVRRRVALKILKPGMDTRQVIARFEAERQALAMMDHPNITRVLDAGASEKGRPYFVMDLVRGVAITEFCEKARLTTRQRIELMIPVCFAVHHAHQKGIIHRDLKPSNVLVTLHDGKPVPKVIDFGIAKALHGKLTDKTLFTQFRQFIGTPAYMSPEQAEMSGLDVDTRTDVYSLGVMLYELLTNTTPFDKQQLASCSQAEVQRIIREVEPPTPSRRVSQQRSISKEMKQAVQTTSAHETAHARLLSRQLKGDLDWIVMRCLEKDRNRRYASVEALAMDLERYLRDDPVEAGPPSTAYRVHRFARKHRAILAAALLIFIALVSGMTLALIAWRDAKSERDAAMKAMDEKKAEAERAQACFDLLVEMFGAADPSGAKMRQDSIKQLLDDFTASRSEKIASQPAVALALHRVAGNAYSSLGELSKAKYHADAALDLARKVNGGESVETARALDLVGNVELRLGQIDGAERDFADALSIKKRMLPPLSDEIAFTLQNQSKARRHRPDFQKAFALASEALGILKQIHGGDHELVATALYNLAFTQEDLGRLADAEKSAQDAHDMYERALRPDHPYVAMTLDQLANIAWMKGEIPRAETMHREALRLRIASLGENHYEVAVSRANLSLVLREEGHFDEAEQQLRTALEILRSTFGENTPQYAAMVGSLGATLLQAGKLDLAEPELRRAAAMQSSISGPDSLESSTQQGNLASLLLARGELDESEKLIRQVIATRTKHYGPTHQGTIVATNTLADILLKKGNLDDAEELYRKSIAATEQRLGKKHPLYGQTKLSLADILQKRGKLELAESELRDALLHLREGYSEPNPVIADGLSQLADVLVMEKRFEEAQTALASCVEQRGSTLGPEAWQTLSARSRLGDVYTMLGHYDDAMPHLLAAEQGLAKDKTGPKGEHRKAIERIVALYGAWKRPEQAEAWREQLDRP